MNTSKKTTYFIFLFLLSPVTPPPCVTPGALILQEGIVAVTFIKK